MADKAEGDLEDTPSQEFFDSQTHFSQEFLPDSKSSVARKSKVNEAFVSMRPDISSVNDSKPMKTESDNILESKNDHLRRNDRILTSKSASLISELYCSDDDSTLKSTSVTSVNQSDSESQISNPSFNFRNNDEDDSPNTVDDLLDFTETNIDQTNKKSSLKNNNVTVTTTGSSTSISYTADNENPNLQMKDAMEFIFDILEGMINDVDEYCNEDHSHFESLKSDIDEPIQINDSSGLEKEENENMFVDPKTKDPDFIQSERYDLISNGVNLVQTSDSKTFHLEYMRNDSNPAVENKSSDTDLKLQQSISLIPVCSIQIDGLSVIEEESIKQSNAESFVSELNAIEKFLEEEIAVPQTEYNIFQMEEINQSNSQIALDTNNTEIDESNKDEDIFGLDEPSIRLEDELDISSYVQIVKEKQFDQMNERAESSVNNATSEIPLNITEIPEVDWNKIQLGAELTNADSTVQILCKNEEEKIWESEVTIEKAFDCVSNHQMNTSYGGSDKRVDADFTEHQFTIADVLQNYYFLELEQAYNVQYTYEDIEIRDSLADLMEPPMASFHSSRHINAIENDEVSVSNISQSEINEKTEDETNSFNKLHNYSDQRLNEVENLSNEYVSKVSDINQNRRITFFDEIDANFVNKQNLQIGEIQDTEELRADSMHLIEMTIHNKTELSCKFNSELNVSEKNMEGILPSFSKENMKEETDIKKTTSQIKNFDIINAEVDVNTLTEGTEIVGQTFDSRLNENFKEDKEIKPNIAQIISTVPAEIPTEHINLSEISATKDTMNADLDSQLIKQEDVGFNLRTKEDSKENIHILQPNFTKDASESESKITSNLSLAEEACNESETVVNIFKTQREVSKTSEMTVIAEQLEDCSDTEFVESQSVFDVDEKMIDPDQEAKLEKNMTQSEIINYFQKICLKAFWLTVLNMKGIPQETSPKEATSQNATEQNCLNNSWVVLIPPLSLERSSTQDDSLVNDSEKICVALLNDQVAVTSSGWINVCRICHGTNSVENLIGPCRCRGSLAQAHYSCLERWLRESSRSRCELCQHHFKIIRAPKYNVLKSLFIWLKLPGPHRQAMFKDLVTFCVYTPATIFSTFILLSVCENVSKLSIESNKTVSGHVMAFLALTGMASIDFAYSSWLMLKLQTHVNSWYNWWRTSCHFTLVLPEPRASTSTDDKATVTQTSSDETD